MCENKIWNVHTHWRHVSRNYKMGNVLTAWHCGSFASYLFGQSNLVTFHSQRAPAWQPNVADSNKITKVFTWGARNFCRLVFNIDFLDRFSWKFQYQFSPKSFQWEPLWYVWGDGQTERNYDVNRPFGGFVKAPNFCKTYF